MSHERITVLLPCHSLEDFPVWSRGQEAEDLLASWTAAWHPSLVATVGRMPGWRGIDRPAEGLLTSLAIVPAAFDHRFDVSSHEADPEDQAAVSTAVVRHLSDVSAIADEAASLLGVEPQQRESLDPDVVEDFYALGLAWLLAELLSRRMRSQSMPEKDAFATDLVAAARAAVAGETCTANTHLDACHRHLETARSHYYPVDVWLLDLLLLASTTLDERLDRELASAAPSGLIASGELIDQLTATRPDKTDALREAIAAGRLEAVGGLWDDTPLAGLAPETILDSFHRGREAWQRAIGQRPTVYGRRGGGSSALLPQLLASLGYEGAVWNLFDGSPLPDPGSSRIRWNGTGAGAIEAIAKPPEDARDAATILGLPEKLGNAMDHEHAVLLVFARYPGTTSPWYERLRRITLRGSVLGRFALPSQVLRETASASITVDYKPDAFRPPLPEPTATPSEAIGSPRTASRREAVSLHAARQRFEESLATESPEPATASSAATTSATALPSGSVAEPTLPSRLGRWLPWTRAAKVPADEILDNGHVRLRLHPETGGILSLRSSDDTLNRLSQRLTRRVTRPPTGSRWEDPLERSDYASMVADSMGRCEESPDDTLQSSGRLLDAAGTPVGRFSQRMTLPAGSSLVVLDIDLQLDETLTGNPLENYAACRFAWNENDGVDLFRSVHTQSVASERNVMMGEHFIELAIDDLRRGSSPQRLTVFPLGLPWHVRSHSHMLDTLLLPSGQSEGRFQLVLGVGRERPWEDALRLMAAPENGDAAAALSAIAASPPHQTISLDGSARLTAGAVITTGEEVVGLRCGVLEAAGRRHQARLHLPRRPVAAWRCSADGKRGSQLTVEDSEVIVPLAAYEWAFVEVGFVESDDTAAGEHA